MSSRKVCVLRTDGTNCDQETAFAFSLAGGLPELVHVNQLRAGSVRLRDFGMLVIPGGFSYGDDIASGVVWANELTSFLKDQLQEFVDAGRLVLGICNGFQVLEQAGVLPSGRLGNKQMTLAANDSGRFECRWVRLKFTAPSMFAGDLFGQTFELPVAHGEGKVALAPDLQDEVGSPCIAHLQYCAGEQPTMQYPDNPNGSLNGIAGTCDPKRRVLGLMPHPERYVDMTHHPNWRRYSPHKPPGLVMIENMVRALSGS